MGFDVGIYEVTKWLPRPEGVVYNALPDLASDLLCAVGEGNAYGVVEKQEMMDWIDRMHEYGDKVDDAARQELIEWANSLPWDEDDCVSLTVNW